MVSHLTNNETYFYRELPQLQVFADHVLRAAQGAQDRARRPHAARALRGLLHRRGGATRWP